MSLKDYSFKVCYSKDSDDIAESFYLPCLSNSTRYDRVSGYFGSTIYILAWSSLKDFVKNGGRMRIICSPYLTEEDQKAIEEGLKSKQEEVLRISLQKEFDSIFNNEYLSAPSRALACLISMDVINIKIAVGESAMSPEIKRLFHDKVGLFYDLDSIVGFRGSINETYKGLSDDGNIESIDVFPNWVGGRDEERVLTASKHFDDLWNNKIPNVSLFELPEEIRSQVKNRANISDWEVFVDEVSVSINRAKRWAAEKKKGGRKPKPHQCDALDNWVKQGHRGIFEHATGSGKTYSALCAIRKSLEEHKSVIVLVPSTDLLKQWEKEIKEALSDMQIQFLPCGDNNNQWKKDDVLNLWTRKNEDYYMVTLAVMDTAASPYFISRIAQGEHLFVVADEVHRMGSPVRRQFFTIKAGYRLGLSATPKRYGDPEGTKAIIDYFGPIVQPPFTLKDAIDAEVLTPYFYKPYPISLNNKEQEEWDMLTKEIKKRYAVVAQTKDKNAKDDLRIQTLMIARSRILKKAESKISLAQDIIKANYKKGQKWIVYCEDTNQLESVLTSINTLPGIQAFEYHSAMEGDRVETLKYFNKVGGIMVSIKCLDEGVDIPSTSHALILASSKNPREFVQRRGRILRRSEGKNFSRLFDAIVVPNKVDDEDSKDPRFNIIEAELCRAIQFGEWSEDKTCVTKLKAIAIEYGLNYNTINEGGLEDEY